MTKGKNTYQIDQSGKVEDTAINTVVACSNGKQYALLVTAKDKRRLQENFRRNGVGRLFMIFTFATLIHLLIRKANIKDNKIFVDIEYQGHTKTIEDIVSRLNEDVDIRWKLVGKSSNAHEVAIQTKRGKRKADARVGAREIWSLVIAAGRFSTTTLRVDRRSATASKKNIAKKSKKVK